MGFEKSFNNAFKGLISLFVGTLHLIKGQNPLKTLVLIDIATIGLILILENLFHNFGSDFIGEYTADFQAYC